MTILTIIAVALLFLLAGCIVLKVYQIEKISRENNLSIIDQQRSIPVGHRILCADCKLHKWFKSDLDGNITNKPINQAQGV